jgi:hypothetical protein
LPKGAAALNYCCAPAIDHGDAAKQAGSNRAPRRLASKQQNLGVLLDVLRNGDQGKPKLGTKRQRSLLKVPAVEKDG